jgi:hypothetical protein
MGLAELGWDETFAAAFERWTATPDVEPARVVIEFNHIYRVWTRDVELEATASGRLKHHAARRSELPSWATGWSSETARGRSGGDYRGVAARASSRKVASATTKRANRGNVDVSLP